tara:strand:+ start:1598 stop:2464 length:867 start_codon:yes stop_codon:yes gene_type:complete
MNNKYVIFIPQGGINDCFVNIVNVISYCKRNKRTLLLDFTNSSYNINFSDYFYIKKLDCCIIYNSNEIKNIILSLENSNCLTVYPNNLDFNLIDLFDKTKKISFGYARRKPYYVYNNIPLNLPINVDKNVILHSRCGGGDGFRFFKNLLLCENIKNIVKKKITLLKDNYLCIHVRNTDIKCDYKNLYKNNKDYIHNFDEVYICTDDKFVYEFFKSKILNVLCFTTFPEKSYRNLHRSNILSSTKMEDLLTDMFIATNSKSILSNSKGGFINLLKNCHKNKKYILNMLS